MELSNKKYKTINASDCALNEALFIHDAIIDNLDLRFLEYKYEVIVDNCRIKTLGVHSAWFEAGMKLTNCIIENQVQYEMGGHNDKPIIIENNVFHEIFVFFDCWFTGDLQVRNNRFMSGCTLWNTTNIFDGGVIVTGNHGKMDIMRMD